MSDVSYSDVSYSDVSYRYARRVAKNISSPGNIMTRLAQDRGTTASKLAVEILDALYETGGSAEILRHKRQWVNSGGQELLGAFEHGLVEGILDPDNRVEQHGDLRARISDRLAQLDSKSGITVEEAANLGRYLGDSIQFNYEPTTAPKPGTSKPSKGIVK